MARTRTGLQEHGGRERSRIVIAVGLLAACGLVAQASCGFVSGSSTRTSLAGSNSMSRKTGITAAAAAPRAIDAAAKNFIRESIKHDLINQFTDGFVYTPFSLGVAYSTPFVSVRGKSISDTLRTISPVSALHKFMVEDDSAAVRIKNIVEAKGDINPFPNLAAPPMGKAQDLAQGATWAVHATWEMEAQGRVQLSPVIEQKPFYLSGHDVFRMDASGRVISHERGFDQDLTSVASYFNPIHHFPSLDSILPISVAQKP